MRLMMDAGNRLVLPGRTSNRIDRPAVVSPIIDRAPSTVDIVAGAIANHAIAEAIREQSTHAAVVAKLSDRPASAEPWLGEMVSELVDEAVHNLNDEFSEMDSHLQTFLQTIRDHVLPRSPTGSSVEGDIDWFDVDDPSEFSRRRGSTMSAPLNRAASNPAIPVYGYDPALRTARRFSSDRHLQAAKVSVVDDDADDDAIDLFGDASAFVDDRDSIFVQRFDPAAYLATSNVPTTVRMFTTAFESGDFAAVHSLIASYTIESAPRDEIAGSAWPADYRQARYRQLQAATAAMMIAPELDTDLNSPLEDSSISGDGPARLPALFVRDVSESAELAPSTELVQPAPDGAFGEDERRALPESASSIQVIKHGRRGDPKVKTVSMDSVLGVISWGSGSVFMSDIRQIRCGRQTQVLARSYVSGLDEGLFASIVTRRRTVDLEMRTRADRNLVVRLIQAHISSYMNAEASDLVAWHRRVNYDASTATDHAIPSTRGRLTRLLSCLIRRR